MIQYWNIYEVFLGNDDFYFEYFKYIFMVKPFHCYLEVEFLYLTLNICFMQHWTIFRLLLSASFLAMLFVFEHRAALEPDIYTVLSTPRLKHLLNIGILKSVRVLLLWLYTVHLHREPTARVYLLVMNECLLGRIISAFCYRLLRL